MSKNRIMLITLVTMLTIGFASLTTNLIINSKVDIGLLESDLDVIFKEVLLNKENNDKAFIIDNGKSFIYSADELINVKDKSNIDYTIMNKSHQYDMEVKVTCTTDYKEYLSYTSETIDKSILIEAGEVVTGNIITELIKENTSETSLVLKCTLNYIPVSRDSIVEEKEYIVSFDTGYEEKVSDIKVNYFEAYGSLPELERKGYSFLGWYTDGDIKVENNSLVKIKENHILHAKWDKICEYDIGKIWEFNYTGGEQQFTVPCDGEYKLETWGAQGGSYDTTYYGGYGAYTIGDTHLEDSTTVYINIGGQGSVRKNNNDSLSISGGYNGGGNALYSWTSDVSSSNQLYNVSGGGATSISTKSGMLSTLENYKDKIIIVSSGGGGAQYFLHNSYYSYFIGGHGGGISGSISKCIDNKLLPSLTIYSTSTQTTPAKTHYTNDFFASFGLGTSGYSGGGGGLYGGAGGYCASGGGSSYIGNSSLTSKAMYCYNCTESTEESTKTISTTCTSSAPTSNCAKQGNGYAKITYLG